MKKPSKYAPTVKKPIKRVAIMARVSSDEQATKYSLDDQDERLDNYAAANGMEVVYRFREDYSAMDFNRPEWKKFMDMAAKAKGSIDAILFTTWDRFGRDVTDSFVTIRKLRNMGIEPRAIEQPLDFDVPESKIMLAVYLAVPDADNHRRSIKIRGGIRQAHSQGRWANPAPLGYRNTRDENNRPIIVPIPEKAALIKRAYELVADGWTMEAARNWMANKNHHEGVPNGLYFCRSKTREFFSRLAYVGKADFEGKIIQGQWQPIIPEPLFYKVQDIINNRKAKKSVKKDDGQFPLKGLMVCSCGALMSASNSKSRHGYHIPYYHSSMSCKHKPHSRINANKLDKEIMGRLGTLKFDDWVVRHFMAIVEKKLEGMGAARGKDMQTRSSELNSLKSKLDLLDDRFLNGELQPATYEALRQKMNTRIFEAERGLSEVAKTPAVDVPKTLGWLDKLPEVYANGGTKEKQAIVGSIFAEKLKIIDGQLSNPVLNPIVSQIASIHAALRMVEKERDRRIIDSPSRWSYGAELSNPDTTFYYLKKLMDLGELLKKTA